MTDIRVSINLDGLTLGDFEKVRQNRIMHVIQKSVKIEGVSDVLQANIAHLSKVSQMVYDKLNSIAESGELVSPIPLDDIVVHGIEDMLFSDYGGIERGDISVMAKFVSVNGYDDLLDVPFKSLRLVSEKLMDSINKAQNPND